MSAMTTPEARADVAGRTHRPIKLELDLCLYRAVTEGCGGRILPFGVRQLIKDYAWVLCNNDTIREAVQLWCSDRATALQRYGDINDWDVSQVTDMASLFCNTAFNDRIDHWDVRNVTSMSRMFYLAQRFNQPLACWDVSRVTDMSCMFYRASSFNQPVDTWDVSQVSDMSYLFHIAVSFNQPLAPWDVRHVSSMVFMFYGATAFNQSLESWDISRVTHTTAMFKW
jgi:surface protein